MYLYEETLELGLANKQIEDAFEEHICKRYKEYVDCFEDVRQVIMNFFIES